MSVLASTDCVKVSVRVRPFVPSEITRGCVQIIEKSPDLPQLTVTGESYSKVQDAYAFNNVFMPEESQEEVYMNSVEPIIGKLFEGYNVTILAYGQTGSGKTHTMGTCFEGNWDSPRTGIIPRALKDIFSKVSELESNHKISLSCNFMELYQENLYDLLSGKIKDQSVCEIREDSKKGIIISGLSDMPIKDATIAARYLMEGGENRTVGATAMNNVSSRSHAIFTVNLKIASHDGSTSKAKFHLVDLAGSERSKKTKATGKRFKEGVKINQGLLALGNVISALGGGQGTPGGYISYRDSKLTRLLQDSLGGNSVTLMIACVSPADYNIEETLSTLRYADRAKKIKNKPVKNLDSNEQEIGRLREIVKELQLKLLGSNGSGSGTDKEKSTHCGNDCKQQKAEKDSENFKLRQQLSNLVTCVNGLQAMHVIEESFYNELVEKFQKLRDLLENTCPAEFTVPDTKIFEEIRALTLEVTDVIQKFRQQADATKTEEDFKFEESNLDDEASNQKMLEYTNLQMQALKEIKSLEREMKIKQDLLDRKNQNSPFLIEENDKMIGEFQATILGLEKELNELRSSSSSSSVRRDQNATKVNMDRKHKVEKLEKDLEDNRKKIANLEKVKKLAEVDKKRVEDLKKEIQEMRSARVALIRQQRSDSDRYKKWIRSRDKEINTLKEKGKKVQNEMKRMERMHEKQQSVLKRKVEEAKAVNKRLQDAMDRGKTVMNKSVVKPSDKTVVVQSYLEHEITLITSTIDAKITMHNLMKDRGILNERLINLQSTVNKTEQLEEEIKQLEEDLEMRNVQIGDLRAKVIQTDLESKIKQIPENFTSIPELRIAMAYILRAIVSGREDFTNVKMKAEDLRHNYEQSEERIEILSEQVEKMEQEHEFEKNKMERDFETKLTYLCMKEAKNKEGNEELALSLPKSQQFAWMTSHFAQKCDEIEDLKSQITDLKEEVEAFRAPKTNKSKKRGQDTFTVDEIENDLSSDSDDDFNFNDSFHDPEWRKTPAEKRSKTRATTHALLKESVVNRVNATGILANISETSDTNNSKRSLNGQPKCSCKGSCATKLCGCKKNGNFCMDTCKCSDACMNLPDESKESDGAGGSGEAVEKENEDESEVGDSPKRAKLDFDNITTPYYPYQAKKRKPLLQI